MGSAFTQTVQTALGLRLFAGAAVAAIVCFPHTAIAEGSNGPAFVDQVRVEVVNVDVVVTDESGNPVVGLKPEDFIITSEGRDYAISNFFAFKNGLATEAGRSVDEDSSPRSMPRSMRRRMAILFDNNTLTRRDRDEAIAGIQQFIGEQFDGTYEWAVVAYGDRLHLLEPFTSNKDTVLAALHRVRDTPAQVRIHDTPQLQTEDSFFGGHVASRRQGRNVAGVRPISIDEVEVRNRVLESLRALDETVKATVQTIRAYSHLSGRKTLMLVTGVLKNLPSPANLAGQAFEGSGPTAGDRPDPLLVSLQNDFNERLSAMVRAANAAGFAIYPVAAMSARLLETPHLDAGRSNSGALTTGPSFASVPGRVDAETMPAMLAFGTGGVFYRTSKYHDIFFEVDARTANAYVLGFQTDHAPEGEYHPIKVKARNPDLVVSHRRGYLHVTPEEHLIDELSTPLTFPKDRGDFEIEVQLLPPDEVSRKKVNLTVAGVVPLEVLSLVPDGDQVSASITLIVTLYGADGSLYKLFRDRQTVRLATQNVEQAGVGAPARFALTLAGLERGDYTVSMTLFDDLTQTYGTGLQPVTL